MRKTIPLAAVLLLSACAGAQLEKQKKENEELREKAGAMLVQIKDKSDEADAAKAAKAELEAKLADAEGKLAIAGARLESLTKSNKDLTEASGASQTELGGKLNAVIAEKDALAQKLAEAQKEKLALERVKNIYRSARDKAAADMAKTAAERDVLAGLIKKSEDEILAARERGSVAAAKRHEEMGTIADVLLPEMQAGKASASQGADSYAITLSDGLLFDAGSAKIRDDGAAILERVGKALKALGPRVVDVESHTDNGPVKKGLLGGFDDAWSLTAARAAAVARWLHEHSGLDPARLSAEGFGEFRPVKPNDSAEGRAANRRIVIEVEPVETP
ncbi:MAG: flagellar motor protein MotB [Elusimicrobiota bacterium]